MVIALLILSHILVAVSTEKVTLWEHYSIVFRQQPDLLLVGHTSFPVIVKVPIAKLLTRMDLSFLDQFYNQLCHPLSAKQGTCNDGEGKSLAQEADHLLDQNTSSVQPVQNLPSLAD